MRNGILALSIGVAVICGAGCGGGATRAQGQDLAALQAQATDMTRALAEDNMSGVTDHFTAHMRQALPADQLRQVWQDVQAQIGPFQNVETTRHEFAQGFNVIFVDARFASDAATLQYTFDGDGNVSGFYIRPYGFAGS